MGRHRTLLFVAPPVFVDVARTGLARAGLTAHFRVRPDPAPGQAKDPFRLGAMIGRQRHRIDGAVLVVPPNRSPRRAVPACVINGVPVGLVPAAHPEELRPWLDCLYRQGRAWRSRDTWAVLAMLRESWLSLGRCLARLCEARDGVCVQRWFSDRVSQHELCRKMAQVGPRLAVYVGHGRSRGLCGYHGLRWHHIAAVPLAAPVGTFVAFSCDTLKWGRNGPPFGCRWVIHGRAAAYVGAVDAVTLAGNEHLARMAGTLLGDGRAPTLGDLLLGLDELTREDPVPAEARAAFAALRTIGNPLQSL